MYIVYNNFKSLRFGKYYFKKFKVGIDFVGEFNKLNM